MRLTDIVPSPGSRKRKKRVGRGPGSGHGKTSCRGHKGQNSRSGGGVKPGFEGGQMPLQRRLPKRGFKSISSREFAIINVGVLDSLEEETITPELLIEKGIIKDIKDGLKILGSGDLKRQIKVKAHAISSGARDKIEKANGSVELL